MRRNNLGIALAFFAIMITALLSLGALVMDISHGYSIKTKLKNAVDLAALAGTSELTEINAANVMAAKNKALDYLNDNLTMTIPDFSALTLSSTGLTIETGVYASMTFTPSDTNPTINALKVSYSYTANPLLGYVIMSFNVADTAIAAKQIAGTAGAGTSFPLAISTMVLTDAAMNVNHEVTLTSDMADHYFTYYNTSGSYATSGTLNVTNIIFGYEYLPSQSSATAPPAVAVGSMYDYETIDNSSFYNTLDSAIYEGKTFIVPIVSTDASKVHIKAYVGFRLDSVVYDSGTMIYTVMGTIIPGYVDNTWGGLSIAMGVTDITDPDERALLVTATGLVE